MSSGTAHVVEGSLLTRLQTLGRDCSVAPGVHRGREERLPSQSGSQTWEN